MAQQPLALGAHGHINISILSNGRYQAQARYRMRSGPIRQPKASGSSQGEARRALKSKLEALERDSGFSGKTTARMMLEALIALWTQGKLLEIESGKSGALRPQTLAEYTRLLKQEVLARPKGDRIKSIGQLRLDELSVETMERFLLSLETRHTSQPRNVRAALAGPFKLAVRRGAMPSNPLAALEAFQKPKTEVHALTEVEVIEYRALVSTYGHEPGKSSPKTMRQLPDLVAVTLASHAARVNSLLSSGRTSRGLTVRRRPSASNPQLCISRTRATSGSRGRKRPRASVCSISPRSPQRYCANDNVKALAIWYSQVELGASWRPGPSNAGCTTLSRTLSSRAQCLILCGGRLRACF